MGLKWSTIGAGELLFFLSFFLNACLYFNSMQMFQKLSIPLLTLRSFVSEPEPCIAFTSLRLSWHCDRPWEARIHSVLILSPTPIGFDWPQHIHSSPNSTANKSLSSDTIQEKVCSRSSSSDIISVSSLIYFGPLLFSRRMSDMKG